MKNEKQERKKKFRPPDWLILGGGGGGQETDFSFKGGLRAGETFTFINHNYIFCVPGYMYLFYVPSLE